MSQVTKAGPITLLVALIALTVVACTPEPPAPPPPPPLPAAPGGAAAAPLIGESSADPFVLSVDPQYCVTAPPPTTTTTTTTTAPPTSTTTSSTTSTTSTPTTTSTTAAAGPPATGAATATVGLGTQPGCYFAYTTGFWLFLVPVWRSTDLVNWTQVIDDTVRGSALAAIAPWSAFENHWAPSVLERPDNPPESRFVLWYTAKDLATGKQCLGMAAAATPAGPFRDEETKPAFCQQNLGGTIDPDPFVDTDGTPYLVFKSEGVAFAARTKIWAARLSPDGRSVIAGSEREILEVDSSPTSWEEPVVEGPSMIRVDGRLHLFYSAYFWDTDHYKVGVAHCDTVFGPCTRTYSTPVLATRGGMLGPGGQTPFQTADGEWRMAFHAWSPTVGDYNGGKRRMRILPLTFPGGNPAIG